MDPDVWGPPLWRSIHFIALNYNPKNHVYYQQFFENLWALLPCSVCSEHYRKNYHDIPIDFTNRHKLFAWTVKMHNRVNKMNGKPEYSYEEAIKIYERPKTNKIRYIYILVIIIIVMIALYYIKNMMS